MNDYSPLSGSAGTQDIHLSSLMLEHGDAILRTCYLLCDDLPRAHRLARKVFILAGRLNARCDLTDLLRIAMDICPVRCALHRRFHSRNTFSRLILLPAQPRRAAILCLYHRMSIDEAASILGIHPAVLARHLHAANNRLQPSSSYKNGRRSI